MTHSLIRKLKPVTFRSEPAPLDDLTVRVAHRICTAVYDRPCDCQQRNLNQVCDAMKNAALHAFAEIAGKK